VDAGGRKNERRILQTNPDRVNSVARFELREPVIAVSCPEGLPVMLSTFLRRINRAQPRTGEGHMVFCRRFAPTRFEDMNHMLRSIFNTLPLVLLLAFAGSANEAVAGEMYRWIDKNGVLNYSQIKPEGVNAEKVITRGAMTPGKSPVNNAPPAGTSTDQPTLTEDQQRKLDELKSLRAEEEQKVAEIKKANCDKSQKLLERLKLKEHVRIRQKDGSERALGEDERQRKIQQAELGIATNCA
jgi:hypothetical protein